MHIDELLLNEGMVIFPLPLVIDTVNDMGDLIDLILLKKAI